MFQLNITLKYSIYPRISMGYSMVHPIESPIEYNIHVAKSFKMPYGICYTGCPLQKKKIKRVVSERTYCTQFQRMQCHMYD